MIRLPRVGLRAKLLLVTMALAAIPLVGVGYVREMETLLREQQEQNLLAAARAMATALNDRPATRRLLPRTVPVHPPAGSTSEPAPPAAAPAREETATPPPAVPELAPRNAETLPAAPSGAATPQPAGANPASAPAATANPIAAVDTSTRPPALIATEDDASRAAPGEEFAAIVVTLNRARSRIWVVDRRRQLLALGGSLRAPAATPAGDPAAAPSTWERIEELLLRPLYQRLLRRPTEEFDDSLPENAISGGPEVERALGGIAAARWRATPDNRAVILSAAHPVFAGDTVVAAVVVEETTNAIQSFANRALEKLISATLAVFVLVAAIMLLFASRLANRVRRLRDEAESAIDAQGRVRSLATASTSGDEIGDLSRSFSELLGRLAQYHDYLENLGARITHEFRTPVAVVRSSLDNLAMQPLPDGARDYMRRAEEGLARLNHLITRMGEARRLEQTLREGDRTTYDAREVVAGCVVGYRAAYPDAAIESRIGEAAIVIDGSPDLLAQALDKLVANALSYAATGTVIAVSIDVAAGDALLSVDNHGPRLPEAPEARARLFDSMVSQRDDGATSAEPHLGLGLYVVRLVAEFHHGRAEARNRADGTGAVVSMRMPLAR
jgi:dedicated sortase system histidine kinase